MDASITEIDVRDMLCAQALAVAAQAMRTLKHGESLDVRMSTEDVRGDLLTWAKTVGHDVQPIERFRLRIRRGQQPSSGS
jgi:TusA-related sulfurtransferase